MEARVGKAFAASGATYPLRARAELRGIVDHLLSQGMRKFEIAQCLDVPSHEFMIWDRGTDVSSRLEDLVRKRVNELQAKHLGLLRPRCLLWEDDGVQVQVEVEVLDLKANEDDQEVSSRAEDESSYEF
jgi:hypothetical protein